MRLAANQQAGFAFQDGQAGQTAREVRNGSSAGWRQRKRRFKPADRLLFRALQDVSNVIFLDIETTGLSRYYDEITIIGWLHNGCYHAHVAGDDPKPLQSALAGAGALVTFNGTLFDIPFIRRFHPDMVFPPLHADLRYLGRRAGLTGGQKAIEKELGLAIRHEIQDVDGAEAVLLWHRYLRGDTSSLRRLIDYNHCDILGMRYLLDEVVVRLVTDPDFWFEPPRFRDHPFVRRGWADISVSLPSPTRLKRPRNTFADLVLGTPGEDATIIGIDLTGSEARPSGWCELRSNRAQTDLIATDDEIVERVVAAQPSLVSIDSPLSLPFGRTRVTDDDPGRMQFGIMRQCERELKRRGINVYPCLLPSMQRLTDRGIRLATRLRRMGIPVIESYPGAAQDIMGIPRKGAGAAFLRQGLTDFGINGTFVTEAVSHDELDAITSALVGSFFLAGKIEALSGPSEDPLIIPHVNAEPGPVVVGISGKIAAGKTTIAKLLERQGFSYTRFSLVVDDVIKARGQAPDRSSRQTVGFELHKTMGQRWLAAKARERVQPCNFIVVDGLRFLEDHAFFVERFGCRFLHLHVTAPFELRATRYRQQYRDGGVLDELEQAPVEGEIPQLTNVAAILLENTGTLDELNAALANILSGFLRRIGAKL